MPPLEWTAALSLDLPLMDETHQEFVNLLSQVRSSPDPSLVDAWSDLIDHTEAHFGQEDAWMSQTRFASGNCHSVQHRVILQVMREGLVAGRAGNLGMVRQMAGELAMWFPQHAQSMDAALALHLRRVGFDPATGLVHAPQALPLEAIHGCGGSSCSDAPTALPSATAIPEAA